jgi:hypothetical protein
LLKRLNSADLRRNQTYEVAHSKPEVLCVEWRRFASEAVIRRKIMVTQVNSESTVSIEVAAESKEVRELSACELDMIGGGFIPGALVDSAHLRIVTGSDGNSYLN